MSIGGICGRLVLSETSIGKKFPGLYLAYSGAWRKMAVEVGGDERGKLLREVAESVTRRYSAPDQRYGLGEAVKAIVDAYRAEDVRVGLAVCDDGGEEASLHFCVDAAGLAEVSLTDAGKALESRLGEGAFADFYGEEYGLTLYSCG